MRFVVAPDSFKGSLSAWEAAKIIGDKIRMLFDGAEVFCVPVADGGEGTMDALLSAVGGEKITCPVTGPLGEMRQAEYAKLQNGAAVVELAAASGLPLVPEEKRNPLKTTTKGTGELICQALEDGAREILVGLGGSATNDGGMGILMALGARFFDENGQELAGYGEDLARVAQADFSGLHPALKEVRITAICDVKNPLLGENGATCVYGPQKGADEEKRAILEEGMKIYKTAVEAALGKGVFDFPGAGAAGGAGAALGGVLGAKIRPGIDAVLDACDFDRLCAGADLVISGEGRIDKTSVSYGKVISGIAQRCVQADVPLMVIAGGMEESAAALYEMCPSSIMTTVNGVMPLSEAMDRAAELLGSAAERGLRLIQMGMSMRK